MAISVVPRSLSESVYAMDVLGLHTIEEYGWEAYELASRHALIVSLNNTMKARILLVPIRSMSEKQVESHRF